MNYLLYNVPGMVYKQSYSWITMCVVPGGWAKLFKFQKAQIYVGIIEARIWECPIINIFKFCRYFIKFI